MPYCDRGEWLGGSIQRVSQEYTDSIRGSILRVLQEYIAGSILRVLQEYTDNIAGSILRVSQEYIESILRVLLIISQH